MVDRSKFMQMLGEDLLSFEERSRSIFSDEEKLQGWCPAPTMWLLNAAVACMQDDEQYLEIGTFCGRSLAAALKGNNAKAQVIDPLNLWTQNGTTEEIWNKNMNVCGVRDRITLHQQFAENFSEGLPKIGVFFYDGNHDSGHTYEALCKYKSYLSDSAIIIVDDYNIYGGEEQKIFRGHITDVIAPVKTDTDRWVRENIKHVKFCITTPWLNGQAILLYEA